MYLSIYVSMYLSIFQINAHDVITAAMAIIMSSTLKVTGNHFKFACFLLLLTSEEAKR